MDIDNVLLMYCHYDWSIWDGFLTHFAIYPSGYFSRTLHFHVGSPKISGVCAVGETFCTCYSAGSPEGPAAKWLPVAERKGKKEIARKKPDRGGLKVYDILGNGRERGQWWLTRPATEVKQKRCLLYFCARESFDKGKKCKFPEGQWKLCRHNFSKRIYDLIFFLSKTK